MDRTVAARSVNPNLSLTYSSVAMFYKKITAAAHVLNVVIFFGLKKLPLTKSSKQILHLGQIRSD